jgi:hypothetical protein
LPKSFSRVMGNHAEAPLAAVEWAGRRWECWAIDQKAKAAFERWLEAQAARPIAALEGVLSDAALSRELERLSDRSLEGEFSFGGRAFCRALGIDPDAPPAPQTGEDAPPAPLDEAEAAPAPTPKAGLAGTVALAAVLFRCDEWDMLRLLKARQAEVMAALRKAFREALGPEGNG